MRLSKELVEKAIWQLYLATPERIDIDPCMPFRCKILLRYDDAEIGDLTELRDLLDARCMFIQPVISVVDDVLSPALSILVLSRE